METEKEEIAGQMDLFDFIEDPEKAADEKGGIPVEIKGLLDDAYCPMCSFDLWEVTDIRNCPKCGLRLDWGKYHKING